MIRDIFTITRSTEQHNDELNPEGEVREIGENEAGLVVFDDVLDYNQKATHFFFTKGRHKQNDVYFLLQSSFGLQKRTMRKSSNFIIFLNQNLKSGKSL